MEAIATRNLERKIGNRIGDDVNILKETTGSFADCRGTAEEQDTPVRDRDDAEQEAMRASEEKARKCLVCKSTFPSAWAGERICRRCKATSAWRGGALG